jgi:hypothetical protein
VRPGASAQADGTGPSGGCVGYGPDSRYDAALRYVKSWANRTKASASLGRPISRPRPIRAGRRVGSQILDGGTGAAGVNRAMQSMEPGLSVSETREKRCRVDGAVSDFAALNPGHASERGPEAPAHREFSLRARAKRTRQLRSIKLLGYDIGAVR